MRILHVLRAPVGGLFRHVRDLAQSQAQRGHDVGVISGDTAADSLTQQRLDAMRPFLSLGLHTSPMSRGLGLGDVTAVRATHRIATDARADVLHGHGAKGGAYARLAAGRSRAFQAFYTPHGGVLQFDPKSIQGRVFMALEQKLAGSTSGLIFESAYAADAYAKKVGQNLCPQRVIPNGLLANEFEQHQALDEAADFLFIGELRDVKGIDVLLEALAQTIAQREKAPRLTVVGDGPDRDALGALTQKLGIDASVTFAGAMPAADAFKRARCMVVPSRTESFPYVVLEAAAQAMPLITTDVGGIPEIVGDTSTCMIGSDDVDALNRALVSFLDIPQDFATAAEALQARAAELFSVEKMTADVLDFYASTTVRAAA